MKGKQSQDSSKSGHDVKNYVPAGVVASCIVVVLGVNSVTLPIIWDWWANLEIRWFPCLIRTWS